MKQPIRRPTRGDRQAVRQSVQVDRQKAGPPSTLGAPHGVTPAIDDLERISIEELHLSTRAYNALKRSAINSVGQLAMMSDADIEKVRQVGSLVAAEIIAKLDRHMEAAGQLRPSSLPPSALNDALKDSEVPLEALGLSVRTYNAVARGGIFNVGQLARLDPQALLAVRNVGEETVGEIEVKA